MSTLQISLSIRDNTGAVSYMGLVEITLTHPMSAVQYDELMRILQVGIYEPMKNKYLDYDWVSFKLTELFQESAVITVDSNLTDRSDEEIATFFPKDDETFDVAISIMEDDMKTFELHDGMPTNLFICLHEAGNIL